jgi:type II secretory pathway component GspD/PulD (secretin)
MNMTREQMIKAAFIACGASTGHTIDMDIDSDGECHIQMEGRYNAAMLKELAEQMRLAEIVFGNAQIIQIVDTCVLPAHTDAESIVLEAREYMTSYGCSAVVAVRDVIDAYNEGEADADDARRNGDSDYGRE